MKLLKALKVSPASLMMSLSGDVATKNTMHESRSSSSAVVKLESP